MSLIIRCSQLGKIMTDGKKGEELSAGAKTYLRELLKKEILGYDDEISSKYLEKGIRCEQESLNLYNTVFFSFDNMPSFRLSPLSSLLGMVRPHLHVTSLWAVPSSAVAAILRLSPGIAAEAEREKMSSRTYSSSWSSRMSNKALERMAGLRLIWIR